MSVTRRVVLSYSGVPNPNHLDFKNFVTQRDTESLLLNVVGWEETPTVAHEKTERLLGHGAWVSDFARVQERLVTITARVHESNVNLRNIRNQVGQMALQSDITLYMYTNDLSGNYVEYLQGGHMEAIVSPVRDKGWYTITIPIVFAKDPFIYDNSNGSRRV